MRYQDLPKDQYEQHFNPRVAGTNVDAKIAALSRQSKEARTRLRHSANVRYGEAESEVLDIFPAQRGRAPVMLFVHGGYWRAMDKSDYSFVAVPFVPAGATVVVINYTLAPAATLDEIVAQTIRSIAWTHRHIGEHGGNPEEIYISGNSAGGHLVAMALAHDWEAGGLPADIIKGASAITGVHDCEPVLHISVNEEVRLDPEMAARNSPINHPPRRPVPLIVAVGGAEPPGWVQMSRDYVKACERAGVRSRYMELPGMDHFDISATVGDPVSELTLAMLEQMGLPEARDG